MAGIKTMELDPDRDNNAYRTFIQDSVGRNKNLWQFACFCSAQEGRCSISLDGGWGTGKTFFLKQLKLLFNCLDLKNEEQEEIAKTIVALQDSSVVANKIKPHICVYYDAWKNDNSDDPLCSILYTLIKDTKNRLLYFIPNDTVQGNTLIQKLSYLLNRFQLFLLFCPYMKILLCLFERIKRFHILYVAKIARGISEVNPVREIEQQQRFHDGLSRYLKSLVLQKDERMIILIDELDRCNPTYAVRLLERIKHYLLMDKITFVFAINEEQLQYTIKSFYGEEFDAYLYLNRFFDVQFSFPAPDMSKFLKMLHLDDKDDNNYLYKSTSETFIIVYSLSIRESIKYYQIVDFVCKSFQNDEKKSKDFSWKMVMYIIVPIAIGLRFLDGNKFLNFLKGQLHDPLLNVVLSSDILATYLTFPNLKRDKWENKIMEADVTSKDAGRLQTIYAVLLTKKLNNVDQKNLFPFTFTKEMLNAIYSASNMMADFIKFDTNTEETAHG